MPEKLVEKMTPEILRDMLRYEPDTGKLFWKTRPDSIPLGKLPVKIWNSRYEGKEAMVGRDRDGYPHGQVLYHPLRAHRVVWAIYHGDWPQGEIDHINGQRDDNRIANLRDVTRRENLLNKRLPVNNTSGVVGVHFNKRKGKWVSAIKIDRVRKNLGDFSIKADAVAARKAAEALYGFHLNHGSKPTASKGTDDDEG